MASIILDHVSKVYPNGVRAVDDVDLVIHDGEFVVLVGPSGCGKSTLLRMIAGLEEVTDGGVIIGDRDVTYDPPRSRNIAMVFQNYALYPHMTVRKNLGLSLKLHHVPRPEIKSKVEAVAATLGIEDLLDRKPAQLSGGQRQRVAMGRALVRDPIAFLMDEPLSNLDAKLRVSMREELARLHAQVGTTTVYVTHDQVEAMTLGTRVAVLRDGVLQQMAPPDELFHQPVNLFCAMFIGSPQINLVEAVVEEGIARFAGVEVPVRVAGVSGPVLLGIRPTDLLPVGEGDHDARPTIAAELGMVENLGAHRHAIFDIDAPAPDAVATQAAASDDPAATEGQVSRSDRARWTVVLDDRYDARPGNRIRLAIATDRVQLFDPVDGHRLTG
jgi:multiple sugar transport system ATP-binding protein